MKIFSVLFSINSSVPDFHGVQKNLIKVCLFNLKCLEKCNAF